MLLSLPYVKFINDLLPLSIDCMRKEFLKKREILCQNFPIQKKGRGKANKKKPSLTYF